MKKFIKSLSLAFVFLALAVVPLLAGCAKTYTVDVSITGGNYNGGYVTYNKGISVYGKNVVEEGEDFIFTISPKDGYYISAVKIDGEPYSQSFKSSGFTLNLENISSNKTVEITFDKVSHTVTLFACSYNGGGQNLGYSVYKTYSVLHGEKLTFTEFNSEMLSGLGYTLDNAFYYQKTDGTRVNIPSTGIEIWNGPFVVYTLLTADQLDALTLANSVE